MSKREAPYRKSIRRQRKNKVYEWSGLFRVVRVRADGSLSVEKPEDINLTESEALRRKAELEVKWPGRRYAIGW
jgi:hypothetical protein